VLRGETADFIGDTMVDGRIIVSPGKTMRVLVATGRSAPPDISLDMFIFGTGTLYENPVPVIAVHHPDVRTVFSRKSAYSGVIPDTYLIKVVPQVNKPEWSPWQGIGHGKVEIKELQLITSLFGEDPNRHDLVHVRPIVGRDQLIQLAKYLYFP
jgi:hypothetical protein